MNPLPLNLPHRYPRAERDSKQNALVDSVPMNNNITPDGQIFYRSRNSLSLSLRANNITTRHPKVKVKIHLDNPLYVGGFDIQGQLEIECTTELKLRIGKVGVEVIGFEVEIGAAPELSTGPPDSDGMWPVRKGKVFLPFSLNLPETAPSVFSNQFSEIRYIIAGSVEVAFHSRKRNLITHQEATVYEGIELSTELPHLLKFPVITECQRQLFLGGNEIPVGIRIRNETRRKISAIKLSLVQCFKSYSSKNLTEPVVSYQTIVASQVCKSKSILIGLDNGVERECTLRLQIPSDARTVRRSRLLDVSYVIQVTLIRTLNSIVIQLPLLVVHQASIEPPLYLIANQATNRLRAKASSESVFKEIVGEGFPVSSKKYIDDSFELESRPLSVNSQKPFVNPPRTPPKYYGKELPTIDEVLPKTLKHLSAIEDLLMEGIEDEGYESSIPRNGGNPKFPNIRRDNCPSTHLTESDTYKSMDPASSPNMQPHMYKAGSGSFRVPTLRTRPASLTRHNSTRIRDRREMVGKLQYFETEARGDGDSSSDFAQPKEPQNPELRRYSAPLTRSTHPNYGFALRSRLAKLPLKSQETPRVRNRRSKEVYSHVVPPPSQASGNESSQQEKTRRISRTPNEIQDSIHHMFGTKTRRAFEEALIDN
ncbi:hypothetical protein K493DRAFT_341467 [Basidiobolus meristosporus CBS 931.73]|uniref:Arrestin C-terminal-like domain-containing protein n=1 Tax=Basidiobolus meristosporus CBS 931.73 TaxID=1314790 RepID=A0A1Y1XPH0_9FUNG|nr:hypothetical protein K493DRAFT_341467 [Basidiobolus meristosporus CBS 931.73]|eukprot:ORX87637.1 hypothetical protein K493DRAFT_341467 [Basidiobolus meristosporus CBS 931.73]